MPFRGKMSIGRRGIVPGRQAPILIKILVGDFKSQISSPRLPDLPLFPLGRNSPAASQTSSFAPRSHTTRQTSAGSSSRGSQFLLTAIAAVIPAACPIMAALVETRAEERAN